MAKNNKGIEFNIECCLSEDYAEKILKMLESYCNQKGQTIRSRVTNDGSLKFKFEKRNRSEFLEKTKIIYGDRASGKTTELIKMCSQDNYSLIICPNRQMCDNVFRQSRELRIKIPYPITIEDFIERRYSHFSVDGLYFDETERILETLCHFRVPVKGLVFSKYKTEIINK